MNESDMYRSTGADDFSRIADTHIEIIERQNAALVALARRLVDALEPCEPCDGTGTDPHVREWNCSSCGGLGKTIKPIIATSIALDARELLAQAAPPAAAERNPGYVAWTVDADGKQIPAAGTGKVECNCAQCRDARATLAQIDGRVDPPAEPTKSVCPKCGGCGEAYPLGEGLACPLCHGEGEVDPPTETPHRFDGFEPMDH